MSYVAVIPARSGSKRVPGKNIKSFLGSPLISYPIQGLISTGRLIDVYVSTDSEEIQKLASNYGAKVAFTRSPELSDDFTNTISVIQDAVYKLNIGDDVIVICAYPSAVLDPEIWQSFLDRIATLKDEFLVTVGKFRSSALRSLAPISGGMMQMQFPENAEIRTQDLPPNYYDAGKLYAARAGTWKNAASILGRPFVGLELPFWAAQDIDTLEDWSVAELLVSSRIK